MPNRIIRESCRTSGSLAKLSHGAERLFWRLVVTADDYGRFEAEPDAVASLCFPRLRSVSESDCAGWLDEIEAADMVARYGNGHRKYGVFLSWPAYQRIRNKRSKHPEPPADIRARMTADDSECGQLTADDREECTRAGDAETKSESKTKTKSKTVLKTCHGGDEKPSPAAAPADAPWPDGLLEIRQALDALDAPRELYDPAYWKRIDGWLGGPEHPVAYLAELRRYLAWLVAQPTSKRHRDARRGFRKWLATAERWAEQRAQREAAKR